jgi:hypothetical protein
MMKEGHSYFIEYQGAFGDKRRAWLTNTDTSNIGPINRTTDPEWMERDPQGGITQHEWLMHKFVDGVAWRMKIHAMQFVGGPGTAAGRQIYFDMSLIRHDGWGENKNTNFRFIDWDGNRWAGRMPNLRGPYPAQPLFLLWRI